MAVGEKLRLLRQKKGIPLEVIAKRLKISPEHLGQVEEDKKILPVDILKEAAAFLGVEVSYFEDGEGNRQEESIGARLRNLREQKGITLSELSRRSGVSLAHISEIERSRSTASIKTLEKLAAVLEVNTSSLFHYNQVNSLGGKIKRLREKIGLTQKELARQIGISHSLVGQIETDRIQPSLTTLCSLAEALGVSAFYFLMEEKKNAYLDYQLAADIRKALQQPAIQEAVRIFAEWDEKEIQSLVNFLMLINRNRQPLSPEKEDSFQEIRQFINCCKEEERYMVLNLIRLLLKNKYPEKGEE